MKETEKEGYTGAQLRAKCRALQLLIFESTWTGLRHAGDSSAVIAQLRSGLHLERHSVVQRGSLPARHIKGLGPRAEIDQEPDLRVEWPQEGAPARLCRSTPGQSRSMECQA